MMLRTPPGKQKRSSPSTSPVVTKIKAVHHSASVVEARATSSPSKKPRLPFGINVEEPDEPFSLRSLRRGSAWDMGQPEPFHQEEYSEDLAVSKYRGGPDLPYSETEEDNERDLDWDHLRCSYKCRNLVKSDVLTSLDSREKEVGELKAMFNTLKGAYSSSEEEKKRLKKRVEVLEQNLSAANEREKAWHKQRMQESDKTEELIRTHITRCGQLEDLLQEQMKKCAEAEAQVQALEARAIGAEEALERASEKAVRDITRLQEEVEKLKGDRVCTIGKMDTEVKTEKQRVQGALAEAQRLQSEIDEMKSTLDENLAEKLKLEQKLLDVEIRNNAIRTTAPTEAEIMIKHLKEELSQCEAEVREARRLKRFYSNVDLLKERLESEKVRADRAEAALTNLADLEWKVKDLESELSAWKEITARIPGVETRNDVLLKVAELQREVVAAVAKIGEANAQVVKLQTALEMANNAKDEAESLASAAQAEVVEAVLNLKRAERKVALITKERDGLKEILASYDEEEAVIASHQKKNPSAALANLGTPSKSKDLRIQQLEAALVDAQQHAKLLGEEIERGSSATTEQRHRAETLALELAKEQERIKLVEREADQLRAEVSILEAKMGRGESNPSATKVLHMVINPESMARGETEVQALRAKLQLHERQSDGCREEDSNTNSSNDPASVTMLKQRVSSLEKREIRYRQVFANKIAVFREACGLIFGYKVQMNEEQDSSTGGSITLFTLRSIYSASEDEQIQFQFKAGNLEMIANEYTASPEMQRQNIMTGSNSYMGSFEFDVGSDVCQPFLQHWFQEEFLHLFYEDEEFRNQVLRCLLSKTQLDSTISMRVERKPRRTWLRDIEYTGLFLTKDESEEKSSYCGDDKSTSECPKFRDTFSQCPDQTSLGTSCWGGPLWNLIYDLPTAPEAGVDEICQYPDPAETSCSKGPLWNLLIEGPGQEHQLGHKNWQLETSLAKSFQRGEQEGGPSSPSSYWKENPLYQIRAGSPDTPRSETDTVHSTAAWLQNICVNPRNVGQKLGVSCKPGSPSLMFSSNPLANLEWEDKRVQFTDLPELPYPTKKTEVDRPPTHADIKEEAPLTPSSSGEERREERSKSQEGRPRVFIRLWDSILKKLFKMRVRVRFWPANLRRIQGDGRPNSTSNDGPSATLPRSVGKVYQI